MRCWAIVTAYILCFLAADANAATMIHAGRFIDGRNDKLQREVSIVVEDGRITSVTAGYTAPKDGDKLINLKEYTVLPGLMDMHTHLMSQHSKDSYTERFFMDQVIELMKQKGTYWVPTNLAGEWVAEKAKEPGYFPEIVRPKAAAIGPVIRTTFAKAYAAGVKIAFGTDSGVSPHGQNAREFELMVAGGMPPMKAIQAATLEASKLIRVEDRLGTIEPKKIADIIAVKGDPLENISAMKDVIFVMKEGAVFKNP